LVLENGMGPSRLAATLGRAELLLVNAMLVVVMAILPIMAVAITYDVLARYLLNAPTIWVSDASSYGLLWIAFLAAPWLVRHDEHVKGEFATDRLGPRGRAVQRTLVSLAGAAVMAIVLWQTTAETYSDYLKGVHTTGSWEIPRYLVWVAMPVGSLFTFLEFARATWLAIGVLRGTRPEPAPAPDPLLHDPLQQVL
jgi:TRAP-type C4-dicarboxylate transport system permease small subunit